MKRSLYMMSLVLGLCAGQAVLATEAKSDAASTKMGRIKKSYPNLARLHSSMTGHAKSILERWVESTDPEEKDLFVSYLFLIVRLNQDFKDLFKELDGFMKEYANEMGDQIKKGYNKDVRPSFMSDLP